MGLFSSSSKSKNETTYEGDAPVAVQRGDAVFDNSATVGRAAKNDESIFADDGSKVYQTTSYVMTDNGATQAALQAGAQMNRDALEANYDTSNRALDVVGESAGKVLSFAGNTVSDSMGFLERMGADAFDFADRQSERNAGLARDSILEVGNAYSAANNNIMELARRQSDDLSTAYDRANQSIEQIAGDSLAGYAELVYMTSNQVADANVATQNATGKAMDYVFQSSKSATERQTETLTKYGTYAAVGIVALLVAAQVWGRK